MAAKNWTEKQKNCINSRGGTLLVSAAAGSGKTSVLVERVISRITDEKSPVDIDRLLIVTFTNAAAAEMKQRLAAALSDLISQDPGNFHLQRQQMLLGRAQISTVHGFCSALIRENFHLLGLPPQFRIGDTAEIARIEQQALDETAEELYKENFPEFIELAFLLSPGKDDRALLETILRIYYFIQSHPYPEKWLAEKLAEYTDDLPVEQTRWGAVVLQKARDLLMSASSLIHRSLELSEEDDMMSARYSATLAGEYEMLKKAAEDITRCGWDEARQLAESLDFGSLPPLRNYYDKPRQERVQSLRNNAKDLVRKELRGLFCGTEQECREDIRKLWAMAAALFEAVRRFSARFSELKRSKGMLDYNDLEHMALKLLIGEDGKPTQLARELSERFEEVLVDEYQDTNAAQDALFSAVSLGESNLFMVGDVKQSIYGFRQAMPEIFLARRDSYTLYDGENFPAAITLGDNFRSRPEITDAVNFVFRQLMSKSVCGMDYDEEEELRAAAKYPDDSGHQTELLIIDGDTKNPEDTVDAAEARAIAERIREIMDSLKVFDKESSQQRKPRYSDFCILLRSKTAHAGAYVDELSRLGIPACADETKGFFLLPEICAAVALLKVIDNPMQDVPLLSALFSPAFGFTPDHLAKIRLNDPDSRLYTALRRYSKNGGDHELKKQVQSFLSRIDRWRLLAVTMPADLLIHRVYQDAALPSIAAAMKNGEQRVANLRILHDMARRFEDRGFRGLSAFIRMIDHAEQLDEQGSAAFPGSLDAVRIISIHRSKGLEFPFVFIAGMGGRFNRESISGNLLIHSDMGVGFRRRDTDTLVQWNTLPRLAVSHSITKSELAEELRVLYVAMTRAREKLMMVMTLKSLENKLNSLSALISDEEQLPPYAVLEAGGVYDWILAAALRHPSGGQLRSLAGDEYMPVLPAEYEWTVDILPAPGPEEYKPQEDEQPQPDTAFAKIIEQRISYTYPYAEISALPAKLAASDIASGRVLRENIAKSRPAFLSEGGLTPAERGTALHTFMQFADYDAAAKDVKAEISRLVSKGYLTAEQGRAVPVEKVERFFAGSLYQRLKKADRLLREVRFTIEVPAKTLFDTGLSPDSEDEFVVVQGIADCVIVENGSLTVVDYKTDYVKTGEELIERYREQLGFYATALEQTLGMPVHECLFYSFSLNTAVDASRAIKKTG